MTYPPDDVMHCLHAILSADEITLDDELKARKPSRESWTGYEWVVIPLEVQEELIARGWIELVGEDELEVTSAGYYYARKWFNDREKAQRKARRAM